jgi:peptide/nickel transport system substrate-binding protein
MLHYSDIDLKTLVPNVYDSWEVSDDGTTYTIHLREGMKWSDGHPLTTDDVAFWWFDFATMEGVGWADGIFYHGGALAEMEVVDDFTFKFTFAAPFGNFPAHLTRMHMGQSILLPKHYMQQFHANYTDEATVTQMAADEGLESWQGLFDAKSSWGITVWQGPDHVTEFPSLSAWVIVDRPQEGLYIWERNPYYWKVDQVGNQLPYLDNLRHDLVASTEIVSQKIIQGELDYAGPHSVTIARYPLYKENEAGNTYIVGDYLSCMSDRYILHPQHTLPEDPVLEEIIRHPNFVKALSVAIDRDEINENVFFGLARMGQSSVLPSSKYYREQNGTAWAQHDPDLANQMLDEMGLDERNSEGWRLRPDGDVLKLNIEHPGPRAGASVPEFTEMVVSHWREVGIEASTKEIGEDLYDERMEQCLIHVGVWHLDQVTDMLFPVEMGKFIPLDTDGRHGQGLWAQWLDSDGEEGEEPPEEIKQLVDNYWAMQAAVDEDERVALGLAILDYLAENPMHIGTVLECPAPLIFNKNMRNLPRPKVPIGWDTYGISAYHPEAFYYEGGERA